jgi:deoxycytidine triphosphate deaminase
MPVLSDLSIKNLMQKNELILNGSLARARHCSYRFRPGKVFHSNENRIVDITQFHEESQTPDKAPKITVSSTPHDYVEPGEYVWIRMQESVKLPADICAFWWQTNSLSRKGLLLMNMSIVEPGYEGPLSCLFVNFSRTSVPISPETTMAKLVFVKLDHVAQVPSTGNNLKASDPERIIGYDEELHREALSRPASFLQIDDKFKRLQEEIIADIEKQAQDITERNLERFSSDIPGAIRQSVGLAAGALAILLLISSITPWVQQLFIPRVDIESEVSQLVERELARILSLELQRQSVTNGNIIPPVPEQEDLSQKYEELQEKYDLLEQRINSIEQSP